MEINKALVALSALGHEQRLGIFRLLVTVGGSGLVAGDIAKRLQVLPNTLSANLSVLMQAGLIASERQGRYIRYRADMETMAGLVSFLLEDCCGGDSNLCAPVFDQLKACGC
ncbi:ArsR/SmtB family transcription factor [Rhizobium sp. PAMB 3182]